MKTNSLIILGIFTIILFFIAMFLLLGKTFPGQKTQETSTTILYSSPSNNSNDIPIDRDIHIYLNNQIKSTKGITIEASPNFEFGISTDGSVIKIDPTVFLEKNKNYKITITSKRIANSPFEINFKTGEIVETTLKQDTALLLKIKNKIPVYSSYFDMTYVEERDAFAVIINSKNCKEAEKSALTYLKKNGVNPKNIKINWYQASGGDASCTETK